MRCAPSRLTAENRSLVSKMTRLESGALQVDFCAEDVVRVSVPRVGIEPTHKGFADLSLTTWVPRPEIYVSARCSKSLWLRCEP